jgi:hypothetical protein
MNGATIFLLVLIFLIIGIVLVIGFSGFIDELQKDDNGDKMSTTDSGCLLPFTIGFSSIVGSLVYFL